MNQATPERLYNLLPAIYRLRDAAQGEPLRALLAVIADELGLVEDDIARLYDNWFIETCDEWVVPYIGDLLGVRGLRPTTPAVVGAALQPAGFTQRAYVANTIAYRRRKGTAAVLEQLARDVTGWPAAAVEFFERLVTTQHLNHLRLYSPATPDLRDAYQLTFGAAGKGGAFERVAHTADVRHIDNSRGKYNIPNVGLFLWPIQAYHLDGVTARHVAANDPLRYTCSPLGRDLRLFNLPQTEEAITDRTGPLDVPYALSRRFLLHNLDACYGTGDDPKSLLIEVGGQAIPSEDIVICNLSDKASGGWAHTPPADKVALDPELGRIAFSSDPAGLVVVSATYGFPGDLGGGPYDRRASVKAFLDDFALAENAWQMGVMTTLPAGAGTQIVATLGEAVQAWNTQPEGTLGIISVMDSRTYQEDLVGALALRIPAGSRLLLVAAGWPAEEDQPAQRVPGQIAPTGLRPHLRGAVEVVGTALVGSIQPGALTINGLLIEGTVTVLPGNLGGMVLAHTTLVPSASNLTVQTGAQAGEKNEQLTVTLARSIVAAFTLPDAIRLARVTESIVDGPVAAPALDIQASTVLGATNAGSLEASNSIFVETVSVARRQAGCVRFCYLPFDSQAPRRYRCQPATAEAAGRVSPHFTSATFGEPAYGYLAVACPPEISGGAEDEGEMGVFHFLQAPQRLKNLHTSLDEYLRFGLEAGVFFAF
jgi:hypothetical protein